MNPFEKHRSSVFVICSPFQALCTFATLRNLQIEDYEIIIMKGGIPARYEQLIAFVKRHSLHYEEIKTSPKCILLSYIKAILRKRSGYERLFIGDFRQPLFLRIGLCYVRDGASLVYLDDGAATVALLKDSYPISLKIRMTDFLNMMYKKMRGVDKEKNLYTIYDNIPNRKFNVKKNVLENVILEKCENKVNSGIYIVGAVVELMSKIFAMSCASFLEEMQEIIRSLKKDYPSERCYYIAHGRDDGTLTRPLCEKSDVAFIRPDMMVELYIAQLRECPKLIIGFNSSALYNIRQMMPQCKILNFLIHSNETNSFIKEHESIAEYYRESGIELVERVIE